MIELTVYMESIILDIVLLKSYMKVAYLQV